MVGDCDSIEPVHLVSLVGERNKIARWNANSSERQSSFIIVFDEQLRERENISSSITHTHTQTNTHPELGGSQRNPQYTSEMWTISSKHSKVPRT